MSKEIEEIRAILNKLEYPTENELKDLLMYANNQQQKIEQLEKDVEKLRNYVMRKVETRNLKKYEELEKENTKLKEHVKELEEVLRGWVSCNYSQKENIQRSKEVLMNGKLTK